MPPQEYTPSLRNHMSFRHDRAGRLLSEGDRYVVAPNHIYWERKAKALGSRLIDAIGDDAWQKLVDAWPDNISWMETYRLVRDAYQAASPSAGLPV